MQGSMPTGAMVEWDTVVPDGQPRVCCCQIPSIPTAIPCDFINHLLPSTLGNYMPMRTMLPILVLFSCAGLAAQAQLAQSGAATPAALTPAEPAH